VSARPEVLALILARGGSKGIPRKNLIPVCGRPLIAYSIDHGRQARHITRTIVSTDDDEIAQVSRDCGAETPFRRPAELAGDRSQDIEGFRHALLWLEEHEGYKPELVVHLRPTGPVRRLELVDEAIARMLADPTADALRSVSWPIQTPYKMWRIGSSGYLEPLLRIDGMPEAHSMPRQALPEVFWQNGYVDIVRPATILAQGSMTGRKLLPFVVNEPIYEIDYVETIPLVEEALRNLASGAPAAAAKDSVIRHPV
jgi:CMP-N-acetylneuraminic acid synthetase